MRSRWHTPAKHILPFPQIGTVPWLTPEQADGAALFLLPGSVAAAIQAYVGVAVFGK
jgi:hypothetical protein